MAVFFEGNSSILCNFFFFFINGNKNISNKVITARVDVKSNLTLFNFLINITGRIVNDLLVHVVL